MNIFCSRRRFIRIARWITFSFTFFSALHWPRHAQHLHHHHHVDEMNKLLFQQQQQQLAEKDKKRWSLHDVNVCLFLKRSQLNLKIKTLHGNFLNLKWKSAYNQIEDDGKAYRKKTKPVHRRAFVQCDLMRLQNADNAQFHFTDLSFFVCFCLWTLAISTLHQFYKLQPIYSFVQTNIQTCSVCVCVCVPADIAVVFILKFKRIYQKCILCTDVCYSAA